MPVKKQNSEHSKKSGVLSKIIYFDEGSVTDFLQIEAGGHLTQTTELLNDTSKSADVNVEGKASFGVNKLFRSILGLNANIGVEAKLAGQTKANEIAHQLLQNTILTDFYEWVSNDKSQVISCFTDYSIRVIKESLGYYIMLSPYMSMLQSKNGIRINNMPDTTLAIDKIDNSLRAAKGYYELIGVDQNNSKRVVFRFNLEAFKNNYKITDLTKMDLVIYAIKVGQTTADKLDIQSELDIPVIAPRSFENPSYDDIAQEEQEKIDVDNSKLDIYDVLLAGVAGKK